MCVCVCVCAVQRGHLGSFCKVQYVVPQYTAFPALEPHTLLHTFLHMYPPVSIVIVQHIGITIR